MSKEDSTSIQKEANVSCYICFTELASKEEAVYFASCKQPHTMCRSCALHQASNETWALRNPQRTEHEFWKWTVEAMSKRGNSNSLSGDLIGGLFTDGACGVCHQGKGDLMGTQLKDSPGYRKQDYLAKSRKFRCPFSSTCLLDFSWRHDLDAREPLASLEKAVIRHFRTKCQHRIDCPYCSISIMLRDVSFHIMTHHTHISGNPNRKKRRWHLVNVHTPYVVQLEYVDDKTNEIVPCPKTIHLPESEYSRQQFNVISQDLQDRFRSLVDDQHIPPETALEEIDQTLLQIKELLLPPPFL